MLLLFLFWRAVILGCCNLSFVIVGLFLFSCLLQLFNRVTFNVVGSALEKQKPDVVSWIVTMLLFLPFGAVWLHLLKGDECGPLDWQLLLLRGHIPVGSSSTSMRLDD